jgi:hypothetical protein
MMNAIRTQLARQIAHWSDATRRLENLENLASPEAWNSLERYLGLALRQSLTEVVRRLQHRATVLQVSLDASSSASELAAVQRQLVAFRRQYVRAETTLTFYTDAINTRTNPSVAALLQACDSLAHRSMAQILDQLGQPTPVVLTYLDKGLGASILKAGLRLWEPQAESAAAAIKLTWHNLHRPTALIHESGHQISHIINWNQELASTLEMVLRGGSAGVASVWASWASEIVADACAFVYAGYGSIAALHDVVSSDTNSVLRYSPGDPHPISYLRVLLGVEMCRRFYGAGPWDDLAAAWTQTYPTTRATPTVAHLIQASLPLLTEVVEATLLRPMRAFGGRPISALIDPLRVSPEALDALEQRLGPALFTSMHWVWTEALRLLALTGFRVATEPERAVEILNQQESWMLRLGGALQAA